MTRAKGNCQIARQCWRLLELVDVVGEDRAFASVQSDLPVSRELLVRMLRAAHEGATKRELFVIAAEIAAARPIEK